MRPAVEGLAYDHRRVRCQVKNVLNVTALVTRAVVNYRDGRSCCQGPDCCDRLRKNSRFDELIAQLQAENRLLEELLGRDATDQQAGVHDPPGEHA